MTPEDLRNGELFESLRVAWRRVPRQDRHDRELQELQRVLGELARSSRRLAQFDYPSVLRRRAAPRATCVMLLGADVLRVGSRSSSSKARQERMRFLRFVGGLGGPWSCASAALVAGWMDDDEAVEPLVRALHCAEGWVRVAGLLGASEFVVFRTALGEGVSSTLVDAVVELASDPLDEVRSWVLRVLGSSCVASDDIRRVMIGSLGDPVKEVRWEGLLGLVEGKDRAAKSYLLEELSQLDRVGLPVEAAGQSGDPDYFVALRDLCDRIGEGADRARTVWALKRCDPEKSRPLAAEAEARLLGALRKRVGDHREVDITSSYPDTVVSVSEAANTRVRRVEPWGLRFGFPHPEQLDIEEVIAAVAEP